MNFSIDLVKLGDLPMIKIVVIGIFVLMGLVIWKSPEILEQIHKLKQDDE